MARAAHNQSVTAGTPEVVFQSGDADDGLPARGVRLACPSNSSADLLARIDGLHGGDEWARIRAGETQEFFSFIPRGAGGRITRVTVDAPSGTATYDFSIAVA